MTQPHLYIFVIIFPLKRTWPFICTNLNSLHPKIICFTFNWFWPAGSGEDFVFLLFCYYLHLEMGNPRHFNKLGIIPPKDDLCQVWLKLAQWFWRFLNEPSHFYIFVNISPLKRTCPFICTNSNSLHPRIICTKFDWIWPPGSGE
jgi:hypothetical protein